MSRVIPNENSYIGFTPEGDANYPADIHAPTAAEVMASIDLTCYTSSINAMAQGNAIPTPSLCSLFETSVPGTSQAQFSGEFYRDDDTAGVGDLAWDTLPRNAKGVFFISRFNGTGPAYQPQTGEKVEVWPVHITSRAAGPLASNTPQTFNSTAAVNEEPAEDAVVV